MKRAVARVLTICMLVLMFSIPTPARAAKFVENSPTAYAQTFITAAEGQQWFLDYVETELQKHQTSINQLQNGEPLKKITILTAINNADITKVPHAIGELTALREIFLHGNKISSLASEIANLKNLENLDLADNNLTGEIPAFIGSLPKLKRLDLSNNQFTIIPNEIFDLPKLEHLDVSYNQINSIPSQITNLKDTLVFLAFSKNQHINISISDLEQLVNLKGIAFWGCNISANISTLITNTNLELVDVAENRLTGTLDGVTPNIRVLIINDNQISGLLPTFESMPNLSNLAIHNNKIQGKVSDYLLAKYQSNNLELSVSNNYLTGENALQVEPNMYNFIDGRSQQYRLRANKIPGKLIVGEAVNLYNYLYNGSVTGTLPQKPILPVGAYSISLLSGDPASKVDVYSDATGLYVKLNEDVKFADGYVVRIMIIGNDGSEYSRVDIQVGTDVTSSGGGGGVRPEDPEIPEEIIEHFPYIHGYLIEDGLLEFHPDNHILRDEATKLIIAALGEEPEEYSSTDFYDVPLTEWSFDWIEHGVEKGYVQGYVDEVTGAKSFSPKNSITRAEFCAIISRLPIDWDRLTQQEVPEFDDLSEGAWYVPAVEFIASYGIVLGYNDQFRPNDPITRAEAVAVINRVLRGDPLDTQLLDTLENPFVDVYRSHWAYHHIIEASTWHEHCIYHGESEGN